MFGFTYSYESSNREKPNSFIATKVPHSFADRLKLWHFVYIGYSRT